MHAYIFSHRWWHPSRFVTQQGSQRCLSSSTLTPAAPLSLCTAGWWPLVQVRPFFFILHNTGFFPLSLKVRERKPRHSSAPCSSEEKPLSSLGLFLSICFLSLCLSHSYESSAEILPHTPRLTHFPTVSGSPASLADSMQQKLAGPRRRRPQNPSAM